MATKRNEILQIVIENIKYDKLYFLAQEYIETSKTIRLIKAIPLMGGVKSYGYEDLIIKDETDEAEHEIINLDDPRIEGVQPVDMVFIKGTYGMRKAQVFIGQWEVEDEIETKLEVDQEETADNG